MSRDIERRRHIELWICWVRLIAVRFAVIEVAFLSNGYPPTSRTVSARLACLLCERRPRAARNVLLRPACARAPSSGAWHA